MGSGVLFHEITKNSDYSLDEIISIIIGLVSQNWGTVHVVNYIGSAWKDEYADVDDEDDCSEMIHTAVYAQVAQQCWELHDACDPLFISKVPDDFENDVRIIRCSAVEFSYKNNKVELSYERCSGCGICRDERNVPFIKKYADVDIVLGEPIELEEESDEEEADAEASSHSKEKKEESSEEESESKDIETEIKNNDEPKKKYDPKFDETTFAVKHQGLGVYYNKATVLYLIQSIQIMWSVS